jgi:thiol-disulfide isomerase/thioredoxin
MISWQTRVLICFFWILTLSLSCSNKESSVTMLTFHIHFAYGHKVYLETVPAINEKTETIDSALVKNGNDSITFHIPKREERPYKIKVKGTDLSIIFINDSPEIIIEANILHPQDYLVQRSPATTALKIFMDGQAKLMEKYRERSSRMDSLKAKKTPAPILDSLTHELNHELADFFQRYINFADTISSPGAFLYIYNNVDFGSDHSGLKKFILHAAGRFPSHPQVQKLKNETLEFLKIFEEEYNVGDELPAIELPDINGNRFSTSLVKGKYVLIDFWGTWCDPCLKYDRYKKQVRSSFSPDKLEMVSIALEPEKEIWKNYVQRNQFDWHQLVDEQVWHGEVTRVFKIDSIPFNFILAPNGKIVYKAVKPDSLLPVLQKIIR